MQDQFEPNEHVLFKVAVKDGNMIYDKHIEGFVLNVTHPIATVRYVDLISKEGVIRDFHFRELIKK